MKKLLAILLVLSLAGMLAACGNSSVSNDATTDIDSSNLKENSGSVSENSLNDATHAEGKSLIAYFAYSENIGDTSGMDVDAITSASLNRDTNNTKGNLQVMAQVIEEKTSAEVFRILVEEPYDPDYQTMLPTAIEQMENGDLPALQEKIENLDEYNVIYLGMPVWNSTLPPALQTFFAENDLSGKTIVPFGIHLGSRFGRILDEVKELAPGGTVLDGFTINAETANDEVREEFAAWFDGLTLN